MSRKAKILQCEETLNMLIECPECVGEHKISIVRRDTSVNAFDVRCEECSTSFVVDLKDGNFASSTERD